MPTLTRLDLTSKDDWMRQRVEHFLARNALQSIVSSMLVVLLFSWLNRQALFDSSTLLIWAGSALLLGVFRLWHYATLRAAQNRPSRERWLNQYRVLTFFSGMVFGVLPMLFFNDASALVQSLIIFVIIGMPAAAAGTHVVDAWTFRLFSLCIVIPSIVYFFFSTNEDYDALGFLMTLFWVVVDRSAARTRASLMENIELTYAMSYRATHDSLVGLLNREELEQQFEIRAPRARSGIAMLFLDLDNFKPLNDTLGHQAGDDALVQVADIIRSTIRSEDLAARLGGDEFIIVLFIESDQEVRQVARRLQQDICNLSFDDGYDGLSVSIGISFHHNTQVGFSRLMRTADLALYDSKHAGKNQITQRPYTD